MEVDGFLYETLTPLSASISSDQPPPTSFSSEPYVVFRNQISLSSPACSSPKTAATDYFSLDVGADVEEQNGELISTPIPAATQVKIREPERTLEGSWFRADCRFKSPMLQLHKEMLDFCDFLSPTPEEQASRNAAVECVFDVIKYIWPDCEVEVFGSFKTGLYLPSSDIDVVIMGSNIRSPQVGLMALSRALSQRGVGKKIQVIAKARVPIIKFVEKRSGISFDISFDVHNGPKAAEFIKGAISKWPPLRPLCLILKVFLQQRELNEVYSGGIGSYALLAMLIAMLRSLNEFQAYPEHNLGVLLVSFFDIYGRKLNTSDVGVSCNGAGIFFFKNSKGFLIKGRPALISIEDPQAPDNDIGKNSFNYFQRTWERAKLATTLDHVVVATDDEKIADCCRGFGAHVIMTSESCRNGTERCNEALQKLDKKYDVVVNIQGDEPLIEPEIIDGVVKVLQAAPDAVFSTAVTSLKPEDAFDPNRVKCVVDNRGYAIYFSRGLIPHNKSGKVNPQFPYLLHLGIQSYDSKFLRIYPELPPTPLQLEEDLEQLKVLENGYKMKVIKVDHNAHGVDTPEDVEKIEHFMRERNLS